MKLKPLLAAAALALSSLAAQAATVVLTATTSPQAGSGVDLLISLTDPFAGLASNEELLSFGFRLSYDTARLAFTSFTAAPGWDDDSPWLGAGQFGGSSFPGIANHGQATLLLGTLHFDALQAGAAQVNLTTDAGNLNHGLSFLWSNGQALNAQLDVAVSAVPEPASVLLAGLGLGLLGLAGRPKSAT